MSEGGLRIQPQMLLKWIIVLVMGMMFVSCSHEDTKDIVDPEPDTSAPLGIVTYSIDSNGGNGTSDSPAVAQMGETLNMTINQTSTYTDPNGNVFTCKPEAVIKLSTSEDTLFVKDFQTLTTVEESSKTTTKTTEGEKQTHKTSQTFSVGGKEVVFDLAYDVYNHINSKKENIEMPYIKLNAARYGTAKADEAETRSASMYVTGIRLTPHAPLTRGTIVDSTAYDVNVAFNLDIESVNTKEPKKQTLAFEVEFLAVVETTTDYPEPVELVKVVYRKDWEWVDSHDNMLLAYYAMVHRDRIYSTGETFTDTFRDAGHFASIRINALFGGEPEEYVSDGKVIRRIYDEQYYDSIKISSYAAIVPNISRVVDLNDPAFDPDNHPSSEYLSAPPGTWEKYVTSKLYTNLDIPLDEVEIVGADGVSDKTSGWYFFSPDYSYSGINLLYGDELRLLSGGFRISFYDTFLVIDGQMINFLEFRGPMSFETHKEDITMPNGAPGMVYTSEFRQRFLGKNFYACRIDSVYQQSSVAPSLSLPKSKPNPLLMREPKPQTVKLPPPYKDFPSFEYGGDPFNPKH